MNASRFKKKRKPNYKRFIILLLALLLILLLWKNAETLMKGLFTPSP